MRRYLVVAHRTLGGAHLLEHLHRLREEDPYCRFHVVVPTHHPRGYLFSEDAVHAAAQAALDEMLDRLAAMRIGATGEVGDDDPLNAVGAVLIRDGGDTYAGIIVSTLPRGISRWWRAGVPERLADAYPDIALTHLPADEPVAPPEAVDVVIPRPPF